MDYGKVLSRAWEITWRWKVLWILGFLAALGRGGTGGNPNFSTDSSKWGRTYVQHVPPEIMALIAGILCLALFIGIAIWVVSVIARGGLIAGVQQVEEEGATSFGQAWRGGASRFWTLCGIGILAAIPLIILLFGGIAVLVATIAGGLAIFNGSNASGLGIVLPAVFCGSTLCCGLLALSVVLAQIRIYAERAAILEGLGWLQAFGRGWEVLKSNLGPTIVLWLIFFLIGLVLAALIFVLLLPVLLPLFALAGNTDPRLWLVASLCCGGLLVFVLGALISAVVETFSSATWTLAYRDLTGLSALAGAEPALE
mgnify:CR=1 FL=1